MRVGKEQRQTTFCSCIHFWNDCPWAHIESRSVTYINELQPSSIRRWMWHKEEIHVHIFKKDFIYLFMRDSEREAETQAEGEAGSLQGAQCGLDPKTPGSCPEPKADAQLLSHPGVPYLASSVRRHPWPAYSAHCIYPLNIPRPKPCESLPLAGRTCV